MLPMNEGGPAVSGVLAYAAITVVAFLLGAAVTVFCMLLRKRREQEEQHQ